MSRSLAQPLIEEVLRNNRRADVEPAYKRWLSICQLDWRLLRQCITCATPLCCLLRLKPFKPEPVWEDKPKLTNGATAITS